MPLKPMLAKDVDWKRLRLPVAVQPKIDGIRVHVQDGVALTRTLKRVPNAEVQAALGRPEFEGLDGEIIVGLPTAEDCYRKTTSFVMSESKRGAPWHFMVFDNISYADQPYSERREVLAYLATAWPANLVLVAEQRADTLGQVEDMESLMVADGYEGVILRTLDAPYKHGRSTPGGPLLKVKRFVDFECVVLDVFEENHNANEKFTNELGRGARSTAKAGLVGKGRLGGLIVSPVDDSVVSSETIFRVGTGFDHASREALWTEYLAETDTPPVVAAEGPLIGRVAKVKSFPIGVKDKPRHPVFLGWRDLGLDG